MADWVTISSMATAGGTLVLALATFSSVRSANRAARVAERSLLAGLRPVLIPSNRDDPSERIPFVDGRVLSVSGHGGALEIADQNIYMALALRNGGSGLAVIHGWRSGSHEPAGSAKAPPLSDFRRQQRDLYIPAGHTGFWQGALRDPEQAPHTELLRAGRTEESVVVDLLYGDHEGGQRTIARFRISRAEADEDFHADVLRYWNVDGEDPR
ncbi:MAG TPA: hypothetical protein VID48_15855 [Solirubrobacteraceae bacterium]|jgi:hypothetical protein